MSDNMHGARSWLAYLQDEATRDQKSMLFAGLLGTSLLLALYIAVKPRKAVKRPPGPLFPIKNEQFRVDLLTYEKLIQKYGTLFGFSFFKMHWLFLCDADVIKEALVAQPDLFAGRADFPLIHFTSKGNGVLFTEGPKWQDTRRFILSVLRTFGFGKNITERIIQEELDVVSKDFTELNTQPTNPRLTLLRSSANVICQLVFGERCGSEAGFERIVKSANGITWPPVRGMLPLIFPSLVLKFPGDYYRLKQHLSDYHEMEKYVLQKVDQHRASIDWNTERDLIDAYLREIRRRKEENAECDSFTDFQMVRVILEMFVAGMDTTGNTLNWCVYLMAKHADVQRRVQEEIDNIIGEKIPQFSDRAKLVYTTAVLHEVERFASVLPFSIPHRTKEDTQLLGYSIPKNTMVLAFLMGAHRDERKWKNPKVFDPAHFYDSSTNSLINLQHLIPFSVGKRACLGESLATQEIFVMFTGLMQRFQFDADPSQPLPPVDEHFSTMPFRLCVDYKVVIRERDASRKKPQL